MNTVRRAEAGDLVRVLALYAQLDTTHPPPGAERASRVWHELITDPRFAVFIAIDAGVPVATCMLAITPCLTNGGRPFATIENVVTDGAHRQRGHGQAVLAAAVAAAWAADCYKVMLATGSQQPSTLRFYENAGFRRGKTAFQIRNP